MSRWLGGRKLSVSLRFRQCLHRRRRRRQCTSKTLISILSGWWCWLVLWSLPHLSLYFHIVPLVGCKLLFRTTRGALDNPLTFPLMAARDRPVEHTFSYGAKKWHYVPIQGIRKRWKMEMCPVNWLRLCVVDNCQLESVSKGTDHVQDVDEVDEGGEWERVGTAFG